MSMGNLNRLIKNIAAIAIIFTASTVVALSVLLILLPFLGQFLLGRGASFFFAGIAEEASRAYMAKWAKENFIRVSFHAGGVLIGAALVFTIVESRHFILDSTVQYDAAIFQKEYLFVIFTIERFLIHYFLFRLSFNSLSSGSISTFNKVLILHGSLNFILVVADQFINEVGTFCFLAITVLLLIFWMRKLHSQKFKSHSIT